MKQTDDATKVAGGRDHRGPPSPGARVEHGAQTALPRLPRRAPAALDGFALGASSTAALRGALADALSKVRASGAPPDSLAADLLAAAPVRLVIAYGDVATLADRMGLALAAVDRGDARLWRALQAQGLFFREGPAPKIAFLFPGHGAAYVGMLGDLDDPIVAETFAEADEVLASLLGRSIAAVASCKRDASTAYAAIEEALEDTAFAHPAVLAADVAMLRVLRARGVEPDMVMGHSLGEWAAAVAAGVLSLRDALLVTSRHARGMSGLAGVPRGGMAAVGGGATEVRRQLEGLEGELYIANINSPQQTIIAGARDALERAVARLEQAGIEAQVVSSSHAFHSPLFALGAQEVHRALGHCRVELPRLPLVGNIDGELYRCTDADAVRARLAGQLASPVQFVRGVRTLYEAGARVFLEVGPRRILKGFAEAELDGCDDALCLATNDPKRGGPLSWRHALFGLAAAGVYRGV